MSKDRESVVPVKRRDCQKLEEVRRLSHLLVDGPKHPDPDSVGATIAIHVERGEWGVARRVLENALACAKREAEANNEHCCLSVYQLGLPLRVCQKLESLEILWADDLAKLSENRLFEIGGFGPKTVAEIQLALRRAGLAK